jgi:response regulator RpfG family c-di-GMP phosphodiesterase
MPQMTGIDLLRMIKERQPDTQVIVITGNADLDYAVEALRLNADDYMVKPFKLPQLSHAVQRALEHRIILKQNVEYRLHLEEKVEEQARQIERLFLEGLAVLAAAIEARDQCTGEHLDRVTSYALSTGSQMELDEQRMWSLWLGSLFHDVGKLAVPDQILNKPGPLTDEEYAVMKLHPELGAKIIDKVSYLRPAAVGILHHQERWDGSGYPTGLRGEDISIEGRILAVCDAFDAMQSDRPYRKALPLEHALGEIERCAGTQFDPHVVEAFFAARDNGFAAAFPADSQAALLTALSGDGA